MTSVPRRPAAPAIPIWPLLLLFVLSGAGGLVYEVVWARQLVLVFGNTSQATATILTGFFGGLAIGGAVGGRLADRVARPLRVYGALADVNDAPDSHQRTAQAWVDMLLGLTWASGDRLRAAVGSGPLITDDRPLPEYFLIRRLTNPSAPMLTLGGLSALLH